jgi:hypothetical protein
MRMKMGMLALVLAASLVACRRDEYVPDRDEREPQIVSISVRTEPGGATVRVNRLERTWTTPCDIADYGLQRGTHRIEIELEGYLPVSREVYYDGQRPVSLRMKLRPKGAPGAPVAANPAEDVKPAAPSTTPGTGLPVVEPPKPADPAALKIEPAAGGTRLKVSAPNAKVRIQAKTVVSESERPGEIFLPDVPPDKVVVELLDAKTDALIASVEFAPSAPAAKAPAPSPVPAPPPPAVPDADRVGEVKVVSRFYGVFVKLDPGLSLQAGEEIVIVREGREIARTKILKITKGDERYPDGAAQVQKEGPIQKGDEVRRTKP